MADRQNLLATKQEAVDIGRLLSSYRNGQLVKGPGVSYRNGCYAVAQAQPRGGGRTFVAPKLILARVTDIHDNYLTCKQFAYTGDPPAYSVPTGATEFKVAKHPENQRQWYDGKTVTDPHQSDTTYTYTYVSAQKRAVEKDDTTTTTTQDQIIIPFWSTDTDTPPLLVYPAGIWVLDDDQSTPVLCQYIEAGPRMWARV